MTEAELQLMHANIHAEYREALADAQWKLAQANAREKVKDARIAHLEALIDVETRPEA